MHPLKFQFLRLKHWVLANNLHGTHSPFVYNFLDQCIYKQGGEPLLDRIRNYSQFSRLERIGQARFLNSKNFTATFCYDEEFLHRIESKLPVEILLMGASHHAKVIQNYFSQILHLTNERSIVVIDSIYANDEMEKAWRQIQEHAKVQQSLDFFHFGILLFRNDQAREHFRLRHKA